VHYRLLGATLVGLAFVLPSFLMVVGLGAAYAAYGGIGWMQSVFYGVRAAVIGIIAMSAYKLTTKNIGQDKLLWAIFAVSVVVTVITQSEVIWLFLGAGVLVWLVRVPPAWLKGRSVNSIAAPVAAALTSGAVDGHKLKQIGLYFSYAGSFVFGSGLAIVPFLYSGVVKEYAWLTDRQFVDAVAVAMITPGPVVITTGFIGYLVSGFWGAVVAAVGTFLPCYLLTVLPAYRAARAVFQEARQAARDRGLCRWRDGCGHRCHRRFGHRDRPTLDHRLDHRSAGPGHRGRAVEVQGAGAGHRAGCRPDRSGGAPADRPFLKHRENLQRSSRRRSRGSIGSTASAGPVSIMVLPSIQRSP
jgi:chromate transport protein ChrA